MMSRGSERIRSGDFRDPAYGGAVREGPAKGEGCLPLPLRSQRPLTGAGVSAPVLPRGSQDRKRDPKIQNSCTRCDLRKEHASNF